MDGPDNQSPLLWLLSGLRLVLEQIAPGILIDETLPAFLIVFPGQVPVHGHWPWGLALWPPRAGGPVAPLQCVTCFICPSQHLAAV